VLQRGSHVKQKRSTFADKHIASVATLAKLQARALRSATHNLGSGEGKQQRHHANSLPARHHPRRGRHRRSSRQAEAAPRSTAPCRSGIGLRVGSHRLPRCSNVESNPSRKTASSIATGVPGAGWAVCALRVLSVFRSRTARLEINESLAPEKVSSASDRQVLSLALNSGRTTK
jgi:hypothetical protein